MIDESGPASRSRYTVRISRIESDFTAEVATIVRGFIGIVYGDAIDHAFDAPPEIVTGIIDDSLHYEAVAGWPSETGTHGFVFRFHTSGLEPGEHTVRVRCGSRDGSSVAQSAEHTFSILPTETVMPAAAYERTWACAAIDWSDQTPSAIAIAPEARRIPRGDLIHLRGWAIDTAACDAAGDVYLILDQRHAYRLDPRQWRPDVSAAFGFPAAAYCGFVGSIATGLLEPGLHLGALFVIAKNYYATYRTDAILMFEVVDETDCTA